MDTSKFAVFILSHGRPDNVITYDTLERCGYEGPLFILIDNEDKTHDRYVENFGDKVIVFDKKKYADQMDVGDNFPKRNSVVYARNANFDVAEELGFDYFLQLDDDYNIFSYSFDAQDQFRQQTILNINQVFAAYVKYLHNSPVQAVAMAQRGEFIGGIEAGIFSEAGRSRRKIMNTFFLSPHKRFTFLTRMNDDVTTYVNLGSRGMIFITNPYASINQKATQSNPGGLTDMYLDMGTYVKSFYTIMLNPSSVYISTLGSSAKRLHHKIDWPRTVPSIIAEEYRKPNVKAD